MWRDPWMIVAIILFIIGFVGTYGYFILKAFGVINSPVWMSYIPIFTSSFVILSIAVSIGKSVEKVSRIDRVEQRLDKVVEDVTDIKVDIKEIKVNVSSNKESIERLNSGVERLNTAVF